MSPRRIRSLRGAAAWADRVGLALVFPADDLVLPSLWEAVAGNTEIRWSVRDEEGRFLEFSPEFGRIWRWKDELPEKGLVCVGKHLRGRAALVSLGTLPALCALRGRAGKPDDFRGEELSPIERDVAEAVLEQGPLSGPELHELTGHERRRVNAAVDRLQRLFLLTGAGSQEQERGWPAVVVDLLSRRYARRLKRLPSADEALAALGRTVLRSAGEVSAADLGAALSVRPKLAAVALDQLVEEGDARRRDEGDFSLWRAVRPLAAGSRLR